MEDVPTLREDCVRASEIYLNYLEENREAGKGMLRSMVRSVQGSLLDSSLVLLVDREIRNAEGITIRVGGTVYENDDENKHFMVQSVDRRRVTITPSPELAEHFDRAMNEKVKIFIEIDLTFLVKRVKEWYEKHGDAVRIPPRASRCALAPDSPISLSANQSECAQKAMSSPLTYIWGAPGTGKTKHVLASCVYSYITAGKKVVLTAPTNNALEQSLRGLLLTLADAGINPDGKVLRMGYPSDDFKAAWPNICESGAFAFLRAEIDEEVGVLKYRNGLIAESLDARAGKVEKGAEDCFPGISDKELKARRNANTARINDLLDQSRKMIENRNAIPILSRFNVIACTVDSCIYRLCPGGAYKPDHVFLDEAGYCSVIKGMALTGFDCALTMLGDHKQLPPVFDCEDRQMLHDPEKQVVRLWQVSTLYLEDAMDGEKRASLCRREPDRPTFDHTVIGALRETHRFGPALAGILAGRVYGRNFCSKSANETRILFVNAPKKAEDKGRDEQGEYRRISSSEQRCIRSIMEHNLVHWYYSVGIITPYTKQRNRLAGSMSRLMAKYQRTEDMDDDVVTVHRSQGREWDVVLFSVTDAYDEKWSTDSNRPDALKLINTAVSRARKLLILIGDAADWMKHGDQLIADLFKVAEEVTPEFRFEKYLEQ